jgi:cyd operon protein YbgT
MWYFTWVLGAGFACAFAILNAMWLEIREPAPARHDGRAPRSR